MFILCIIISIFTDTDALCTRLSEPSCACSMRLYTERVTVFVYKSVSFLCMDVILGICVVFVVLLRLTLLFFYVSVHVCHVGWCSFL